MRWTLDKSVLPTVYVLLGLVLAVVFALTATVFLPDENRVLPGPGVGQSARPEVSMPDESPRKVEQGRVYYVQLCLSCHGVRGDGLGEWAYRVTPYPADLRKARTQNRSDETLFRFISKGLIGTPMIGWEKQLSPAQRWQLVAYLRHLAKSSKSKSKHIGSR
jgi:mono/diheme cytochrome c family protein